MPDRKHFATQEQIWWELDKLCIQEAEKGNDKASDAIEGCMPYLKKPTPETCRKWYNEGY